MYLYETHLHTSPVSACAKADVGTTLAFYKQAGYDGVFITNHFLDGNIGGDRSQDYKTQLDFYFSDYQAGVQIGGKLGLKVFLGVEMSYKGTDFLVYGLPVSWYFAHPEIMQMKVTEKFPMMMEAGALVIQAHPYREAHYIDHIRLFPRSVQGVETLNACRTDTENEMAHLYARGYGLKEFAGSDNHCAGDARRLAGMTSAVPIENERQFIQFYLEGKLSLFSTLLADR